MADEMIDVFDDGHNPLGVASKSLAHRIGLWHYSIHCWMYGRQGDGGYLLFQKRGRDKELFPNALDISAAGHYQAGENVEDGVREMAEELRFEVEFQAMRDLGLRTEVAKVGDKVNREFCHVYLLEVPLQSFEFDPDPSEVEGLVQIGVKEGLDLFSGRCNSARAEGIEFVGGVWQRFSSDVDTEWFIPRVDRYYYKMFMLTSLALRGEEDLAV
jgi:isopentenyldiphosphate isomerase